MEASALQAPATLPQTGPATATPLLRFRSDDQLVALFRAGYEEAFRAIHERYHKRLFAYTRQMLPGRQDAEDALQDVFVRAYSGLRASDHQLALRAWLFRVAHNRCIDELRRPSPPAPEVLQLVRSGVHDPLVEVDLRESLRRLIEDIRRLPEQQRSALLMRELGGMSYADVSTSLGISVGAVKSLLVRARVALAQAAEARDTSCLLIREQLVEAHDRGIRPNATTRKHMRDCIGCKSFRRELRGMSRQLAAFGPAVGPLGILAKTLGLSGGAGGSAAGGGGLALLSGGGITASAGGVAVGVNHIATLLVAAVATAGGAVELQHTIIPPAHHPAHARTVARHRHRPPAPAHAAAPTMGIGEIAGAVEATVSTAPKLAATADVTAVPSVKAKLRHKVTAGGAGLSPSTGVWALSKKDASSESSRTGAGLQGSNSSAAGAAGCSVVVLSGSGTGSAANASAASSPASSPGSGSGTGTSTSTSNPSTGASTTPSSASTESPCVTTSLPSTETQTPASASGNSSTSATGASSGSGTTSSASGTGSTSGSGGNAPSSASGSGSSSPSTASTGGSSSTASK